MDLLSLGKYGVGVVLATSTSGCGPSVGHSSSGAASGSSSTGADSESASTSSTTGTSGTTRSTSGGSTTTSPGTTGTDGSSGSTGCAQGECVVPCNEHADCLESLACHLDGPEVGTCFDETEVVTVVGDGELLEVLDSIGEGDVIAIHIYTTWEGDIDYFNMRFEGNVEVALIGPEPVYFHGIEEGGLVQVGPGAIVYIDNLRIGENPGGSAIDCDGGRLWVHRSAFAWTHEALDLRGGCQAHVSRIVTSQNTAASIRVRGADTALQLENALISGDHDDEPLVIEDGSVSVAYTTLGGRQAGAPAVTCTGSAQLDVRNSIVLTPDETPEIACASFEIHDSVTGTDHGGTNVAVGAPQSGWFAAYEYGRLHLGPDHPFAATANPVDGDPVVDVDGDPRNVALAGGDVPGAEGADVLHW